MRIISSQSFFLYGARPTVISTKTEQSGVERRNLQPQWHRPIAVGDLGAQSNNRFQTPLSPYRHAAPLEMTCWRAAHSHGEQKQMTQIPHPPTCHFDWNGAKQSGVEWSGVKKSPAPMAQPHCGGRSRGSEPQWSSNTLTFLPIRSPARDDRAAYHHFGKFQTWIPELHNKDSRKELA